MYTEVYTHNTSWSGVNAWMHTTSEHKHRCPRSVWECRSGGSLPSSCSEPGGKREAVPGHSGTCFNSSLGLFPSCHFFIFFPFLHCNRADSTATGRVFNESNPLDCLISCGQACFWQLTFPTVCCWNVHTPQQLTQCWKHNTEERESSLQTAPQTEGREECI